jgi:hypothetical protein
MALADCGWCFGQQVAYFLERFHLRLQSAVVVLERDYALLHRLA